MTVYDLTDHDINVGGEEESARKKRVNNERSQVDLDREGLPPYSDLTTPSPYPRVTTVPISLATESDGEAVDIRIDDDFANNPFPSGDTTSMVASTSKLQDNAGIEEQRIWFTPNRSTDMITSGSKYAWQIRFDAIESNSSLHKLPTRSATLPATEVEHTRNSRSFSISQTSALSQSPNDVAVSYSHNSHVPLTLDNLTEALPHPSAIFHPETMQWQVVLGQKEFSKGFKCDETESTTKEDQDDVAVWQFLDTKDFEPIEDGIQLLSIPPIERDISQAAWTSVKTFNRWCSAHGRFVYSTTPGSLKSIVPKALLSGFQAERVCNPRPGVSGILQFQDSASTLIKIVGNAANGEARALMLSGVSISTKLGMDQYSEGILTAIGFTQAEQNDEQSGIPKKVIRPPDVSSKFFQLRLRRAWIELVLWYSFEASFLTANDVGQITVKCDVPFYPRSKSSVEYLSTLFGRQQSPASESMTNSASIPENLAVQLAEIGIDVHDSDELVEKCYKLNIEEASFLKRTHAFAALSILAEKYRPDSEILQTLVAMERSKQAVTEQELIDAFFKIIGDRLESIEDSMPIDESFILDMYNTAVQDVASEPARVQGFKEALSIISLSRGKPDSIETVLNQPVELSLKKAYEMLDVTAETDDDFISSAYTLASMENKYTEAQCIEALRIISKHRKSAALSRLYRSATGEEGILDWELADSEKPAGLNNIGNTCYLNSVLQYFYAIKPIRERVLEAGIVVDEAKLSTSNLHLQIGGRRISQREFDRSQRFVKLLSQLFSAMMTSPISAVTPERELAYLALVSSEREESLGEADEVNSKVSDLKALEASHNSAGTDVTLVEEPKSYLSQTNTQENIAEQTIYSQTFDVAPQASQSQALHMTSRPNAEQAEVGQRRNSLMQLGAQQDVSECLDNVMLQVEAALTVQEVKEDKMPNSQTQENKAALSNFEDEWITDDDLLRRLFLGRTTQRLELEDEGSNLKGIRSASVHTKREVFKILPIVVVEEGRDIYDGLDGFFAEETLTHESGRPMNRTVSLIDAPAVLQIQLQRVQYDRKRNTTFKSQAHLAVNETIFMDRYLDFDPTKAEDQVRIEKRKRACLAREEIARLHARIRSLKAPDDGKKPVARALERSGSLLTALEKVKNPLITTTEGEQEASTESCGGIPKDLFEDGLSTFLEQESKRVEEEIKRAEEEIVMLKMQVESLWEDERRIEYVLASVFMHRGEASHGHYFLNQRKLGSKYVDDEVSNGSTWFKYNDNVVQEIPLSDVMKDKTGATPYLLSFVRKDMQDTVALFDTICRQVDKDSLTNRNQQQQTQQDLETIREDVDMKENIDLLGKRETEEQILHGIDVDNGDVMDTGP